MQQYHIVFSLLKHLLYMIKEIIANDILFDPYFLQNIGMQ